MSYANDTTDMAHAVEVTLENKEFAPLIHPVTFALHRDFSPQSFTKYYNELV